MPGTDERDERVARLEERLAVPVVVAALVSVPAVFLAGFDGALGVTGEVLNWASLLVLTGETVVLFLLARDRVAWLRDHVWVVAVAVAAVPAVILAVGPVQVLRLLRVVSALRVLRAGRILRAGQVLWRRLGLTGRWGTVLVVVCTGAAAAFVAVVLSDPTSRSRTLITGLPPGLAVTLGAGAAAILLVATVVVLRNRDR